MRVAYWDTSCVLALYTPENISSRVAKVAATEKGPLHSSSILEFEMTFALNAKEARGEIPKGSAAIILERFQGDLKTGRFLLIPPGIDIKIRTKEIASRLLKSKPPVFVRTLDGIHLATALELGKPELHTADKKMAFAACLLGIKTNLFDKNDP